MPIHGESLLRDDGVVRPVIHGEILVDNGAWIPAPCLVDTGADRTVFSATILAALRLRPVARQEYLGGLGGTATSVLVETQVRFNREAGGTITLRGQYAAVTALEALDISVLGVILPACLPPLLIAQGMLSVYSGSDIGIGSKTGDGRKRWLPCGWPRAAPGQEPQVRVGEE